MSVHARIVEAPEQARSYLRWTRRCLEHLRQEGATVTIHWAGPKLDLAAFREEWRRALDTRINLAGGLLVREPRDEDYRLRRDQQRIAEHFGRPRVRHYGLETRLVRKRCPEIHAEMQEHFNDAL